MYGHNLFAVYDMEFEWFHDPNSGLKAIREHC